MVLVKWGRAVAELRCKFEGVRIRECENLILKK